MPLFVVDLPKKTKQNSETDTSLFRSTLIKIIIYLLHEFY